MSSNFQASMDEIEAQLQIYSRRVNTVRRMNWMLLGLMFLAGTIIPLLYLQTRSAQGDSRDYAINLSASFMGGLFTFVIITSFERGKGVVDKVEQMLWQSRRARTLMQQINGLARKEEDYEKQIKRLLLKALNRGGVERVRAIFKLVYELEKLNLDVQRNQEEAAIELRTLYDGFYATASSNNWTPLMESTAKGRATFDRLVQLKASQIKETRQFIHALSRFRNALNEGLTPEKYEQRFEELMKAWPSTLR